MTAQRLQRIWLVTGLLGLLLLGVLSLLPVPELPGPDVPHSDKWMHLTAYALVMLWFAQLTLQARRRLIILVALTGYGVFLEWAQGQTAWRETDPLDAVSNTLGLLMGLVIASTTPAGRMLDRWKRRMAARV